MRKIEAATQNWRGGQGNQRSEIRARVSSEGARRRAHESGAQLAANVRRNLAISDFTNRNSKQSSRLTRSPRLSGTESIELLFSPNPGEPLKPLRTVASSGEISRLMLAIKSSLAMQDAIPVLVFDEIDANVGGEIANAVGAKMRALAKKHQVLCITHLPQVAAARRRSLS